MSCLKDEFTTDITGAPKSLDVGNLVIEKVKKFVYLWGAGNKTLGKKNKRLNFALTN